MIEKPIAWKNPKFLKLNGIWVCVAEANARRVTQEIGSSGRSFLGRFFKEKTVNKIQYQFRTIPMHPRKACGLEHIIQGDGESYPLEEDTYSVKGRAPLSLDITPAYYIESVSAAGRYGGGALYPHYNDNISDIIDTAGSSASWFSPGTVSFTDEPTEGYYNPGCVKLAYPAPTSQFGEIEIKASSLDTVDYVVSFWAKLARVPDIGSEFNINIRDNTSFLGFSNDFRVKPNPYEWTRYEFAFQTNSTLEPLTMQIEVNGDSFGGFFSTTELLVDGIMLETPPSPNASPFRTTSGIGTDGGEHIFDVDWSQHYDGFTVSFWSKVTGNGLAAAVDGDIFRLSYTPVPDFEITLNRESSIPETTLLVGGTAVANTSTETLIDMFTDEEYHMFTLVYRRKLAYDEVEFQVFYDGGLIHSFEVGLDDLDLALIDRFTWVGDTDQVQLSDLQILEFPVSDQIVRDWFESGVKQGISPKMLAEGLFEKRQSVEVIGEVTDVEYISAHVDGEFVNNAVVMTFNLNEV